MEQNLILNAVEHPVREYIKYLVTDVFEMEMPEIEEVNIPHNSLIVESKDNNMYYEFNVNIVEREYQSLVPELLTRMPNLGHILLNVVNGVIGIYSAIIDVNPNLKNVFRGQKMLTIINNVEDMTIEVCSIHPMRENFYRKVIGNVTEENKDEIERESIELDNLITETTGSRFPELEINNVLIEKNAKKLAIEINELTPSQYLEKYMRDMDIPAENEEVGFMEYSSQNAD